MSFYVSRNHTPVVFICLVVLALGSYYLINQTQAEKRERAEQLAAQAAKTKKHASERVEQRKKYLAEKAVKLAALEALEAQKKAKLDALSQAEAERKHLAQELIEKLEAERLFMEEKQAERELAWKRYVGTKYPELIASGKSYKDVTILKASSDGVTFSYEHGAKKYPYVNLPKEILEICMYDAEFTASYIAMKEKENASKISVEKENKQLPQNSIITPAAPVEILKSAPAATAVAVKGNLTVRLIATTNNSSRTYRSGSIYRSHYKTLSITAISSVPATIYNNSVFVRSVPAMNKIEFTLRTSSTGKYRLELRDQSGRVLDREAWNRKTGLGGSSGL